MNQYFAKDWDKHKMDGFIRPFHRFENDESEIAEIDEAGLKFTTGKIN